MWASLSGNTQHWQLSASVHPPPEASQMPPESRPLLLDSPQAPVLGFSVAALTQSTPPGRPGSGGAGWRCLHHYPLTECLEENVTRATKGTSGPESPEMGLCRLHWVAQVHRSSGQEASGSPGVFKCVQHFPSWAQDPRGGQERERAGVGGGHRASSYPTVLPTA